MAADILQVSNLCIMWLLNTISHLVIKEIYTVKKFTKHIKILFCWYNKNFTRLTMKNPIRETSNYKTADSVCP